MENKNEQDQKSVLSRLRADVAALKESVLNIEEQIGTGDGRVNWSKVNQQLVTLTATARDVRDGIMAHNHGRLLLTNET